LIDPLARLQLESGRPNLRDDGYLDGEISPRSKLYNCFAWAAGESHIWWEPNDPRFEPHDGPRYWPPGVSHAFTIVSFVQAFASLGYEECESPDLEPGFEKVALYVDDDGDPSHAARQLESGSWTSKIGTLEDVEHRSVSGVEGPAYGHAVRFLRRPREQS
jgi:hypothetical protein